MKFYQKGLGVGFLLLGLAFALPCPALGQTVQVLSQGCGTGKPSPGNNALFVDTTGNLCTGAGGGGAATNGSITAAGTNGTVAQAVQGITGGVPVGVSATALPLPAGAATSANQSTEIANTTGLSLTQNALTAGQSGILPLCGITSALPNSTNATSAPFNCTTTGQLRVLISGANAAALLQDNSTNALLVEPFPSATSGSAVPPSQTSAVASSLILKASAGNLYGAYATSTVAGFLLVVNSATVPAVGAVAPVECVPVAANGEAGVSYPTIPEQFTNGMVALFSTTGCFTYTASATAFIHGNVK